MKDFKNFYKHYKFITEGGAAGHLNHLTDNRQLTFGELKTILKQLFSGKIKVSEKTDGQNLAVTWKDGKIGLARNKATIREPLDISQTKELFKGRGEIEKAFVNSLSDLNNALKSIPEKEKDKWFNNGKNFLSVEIIYPPTKNVIDYDNRSILLIHGMMEYDDKQNKVGFDPELGNLIFKELQKKDALHQQQFEISQSSIVDIKNANNAKDYLKETLSEIDNLMKENNLDDTTTIEEYAIKSTPDYNNLKTKKAKSDALNKAVIPLEEIILKGSAKLLKQLSPFITMNSDKKVKALQDELTQTIDDLDKAQLSSSELERVKKNIAKLDKIGLDNIAPIEGLVFKYKGNDYKITGSFAPIGQLLGILKYRK